MLRLLRFILTGDGHVHKYNIIKETIITREGGIVGDEYHTQCEVCGKIKFTNNVAAFRLL